MKIPPKKPKEIKDLVVLCSLILVVAGGSACRTNAPTVSPGGLPDGAKSAAESIAEASALYAQRKDLSKVRSGIAVLRQVRIHDDGNYEAAWKLAKFDYYLGLHATDNREREAAFQEGVEAGRIAVHLQGDKADGHFTTEGELAEARDQHAGCSSCVSGYPHGNGSD